MASTDNLRLRRSATELHALASVEREIRAQDSNGRRKYLREFSQAFGSYDSLLDKQQIRNALAAADLVLIGDYHALPAAQRYAASLIEQRALAGDRPVVLGVETIFARHQHILDEWWRREIDESELRQRIRFDLDWGYDWAPFYELLVAARDHGEGIYGLDCMPRENLRKIGERDRHAAAKIAEIREHHPDAVIFVLFGESHLAPTHLPFVLHKALPEAKFLPCCKTLMPFTGGPLASLSKRSMRCAWTMTWFAYSTLRRSRSMKVTVCFSISGVAAILALITLLRFTT